MNDVHDPQKRSTVSRFIHALGLGALGLCALAGRAIAADAPPPAAPENAAAPPAATAVATAPPAAPGPAAPPPPYSLPWQLRPLGAATVLRLDNTVALYENAAGQSGASVTNMLAFSYKVSPSLAPLFRIGFVRNGAPEGTADGSSLTNPILGLTYAKRIDSLRWAAFGAAALPFGMGGGSTPDAGAAAANAAGIAARSAMDNAMFAVNYFTAIVGGGVGYVDHKLTVQLEATVLQLFRARGEGSPAATDSTRTNSTAGLHVGYFVLPMLSLGGELRYQRWLSTPTTPTGANIPSANMDTVTVAVGPRAHFAFGKGNWFRPGISYSRGLDAPLKDAAYNMVQLDLPVSF